MTWAEQNKILAQATYAYQFVYNRVDGVVGVERRKIIYYNSKWIYTLEGKKMPLCQRHTNDVIFADNFADRTRFYDRMEHLAEQWHILVTITIVGNEEKCAQLVNYAVTMSKHYQDIRKKNELNDLDWKIIRNLDELKKLTKTRDRILSSMNKEDASQILEKQKRDELAIPGITLY